MRGNYALSSNQAQDPLLGGGENQNPIQVQDQLKDVELKFSNFVIEIEILPKPQPETYDRSLQADLEPQQVQAKGRKESLYEKESDSDDEKQKKRMEFVKPDIGLIDIRQNGEGAVAAPVNKQDQIEEDEAKFLDKEDSKTVMKSKEFENFLNKTSKIVERALTTNIDILGAFFDDSEDENSKALGMMKGDKITSLFTFQDNEPMRRAITSIEWSPKVSELLMCSYSKCNEWKVDEPDGMINLYSMALRKRPEHTLYSQYEITKAIFNPFQPSVVVGATYSGYILQWDIRAKNIPIQKSCLAKNGHNHPVYSLAIVGSQNAHNIVSISNDGKCCFWSFGMLNEPKMSFNLGLPQTQPGAGSGESSFINTTCMDFPEDETDKFFIGSEDYNVYGCSLHSNNQQHIEKQLASHQAPITKISVHPGSSQSEKSSDISDLVLSASMDWTVKLWYPKVKNEPIYTFESSQEYVYDVQWSTVHPSLFATCDGDGYLDLWDINKDVEAPVARKKTGQRALNCLRWSMDGRKIATGDSEGFVSLWSVDKEISMQKNDDFIKLERLIQQHQQQLKI